MISCRADLFQALKKNTPTEFVVLFNVQTNASTIFDKIWYHGVTLPVGTSWSDQDKERAEFLDRLLTSDALPRSGFTYDENRDRYKWSFEETNKGDLGTRFRDINLVRENISTKEKRVVRNYGPVQSLSYTGDYGFRISVV